MSSDALNCVLENLWRMVLSFLQLKYLRDIPRNCRDIHEVAYSSEEETGCYKKVRNKQYVECMTKQILQEFFGRIREGALEYAKSVSSYASTISQRFGRASLRNTLGHR